MQWEPARTIPFPGLFINPFSSDCALIRPPFYYSVRAQKRSNTTPIGNPKLPLGFRFAVITADCCLPCFGCSLPALSSFSKWSYGFINYAPPKAFSPYSRDPQSTDPFFWGSRLVHKHPVVKASITHMLQPARGQRSKLKA